QYFSPTTCKITVRTTTIVQPYITCESSGSKITNLTQSYHVSHTFSSFLMFKVEQLLTNHVLTSDPRTLLTLTLVAIASAIQLVIFAVICVFYDGCPYYIGVVVGFLLLSNATVVFVFCKCKPSRGWLIASCIAASFSFVQSVSLFFWTAYLVNNEDKYIERIGAKENRIVTSTRIAMYSLQMIFAPIHAISTAIIVFVLYENLRSQNDEKITHGYFLSEPQLGHQKILVPIELRQVRDMSDEDTENASVGVQTSGTRTQQV
uniref:G protein-coupled receptor n=1 Tax=Angiostrongylus cantonensis TaxID=6313 RepID=A0A0K0DFX5_ANGCA